jgi:hypothetical protein
MYINTNIFDSMRLPNNDAAVVLQHYAVIIPHRGFPVSQKPIPILGEHMTLFLIIIINCITLTI